MFVSLCSISYVGDPSPHPEADWILTHVYSPHPPPQHRPQYRPLSRTRPEVQSVNTVLLHFSTFDMKCNKDCDISEDSSCSIPECLTVAHTKISGTKLIQFKFTNLYCNVSIFWLCPLNRCWLTVEKVHFRVQVQQESVRFLTFYFQYKNGFLFDLLVYIFVNFALIRQKHLYFCFLPHIWSWD